MSENLFATFRSRFPADLSKAFLERPDGSIVTYADLIRISGQLANALKRLGVKPGDRVAVQVEKSAEALLVYLAALRAGAVYLPLNSAYTASEVRYFLDDAEPAVFVCRPEAAADMKALAAEVGVPSVETLGSTGEGSLMEAARAETPEFDDVAQTRDDLAAILYTSGTTGRSKGAMLSHGNLKSNADALRQRALDDQTGTGKSTASASTRAESAQDLASKTLQSHAAAALRATSIVAATNQIPPSRSTPPHKQSTASHIRDAPTVPNS